MLRPHHTDFAHLVNGLTDASEGEGGQKEKGVKGEGGQAYFLTRRAVSGSALPCSDPCASTAGRAPITSSTAASPARPAETAKRRQSLARRANAWFASSWNKYYVSPASSAAPCPIVKIRFFPACFAWINAWSALRISSSRVVASHGNVANPPLIVI